MRKKSSLVIVHIIVFMNCLTSLYAQDSLATNRILIDSTYSSFWSNRNHEIKIDYIKFNGTDKPINVKWYLDYCIPDFNIGNYIIEHSRSFCFDSYKPFILLNPDDTLKMSLFINSAVNNLPTLNGKYEISLRGGFIEKDSLFINLDYTFDLLLIGYTNKYKSEIDSLRAVHADTVIQNTSNNNVITQRWVVKKNESNDIQKKINAISSDNLVSAIVVKSAFSLLEISTLPDSVITSIDNFLDNRTDINFELINYPNPFNPNTTLQFNLMNNAYVNVEVYDIVGNKIINQDLGYMESGKHFKELNLSRFTSGIYFVKFRYESQIKTLKITLLK